MDALLKIEGGSLKGAATELSDALVKIIESKGEQATIQKAIEAFKATVTIEGININNCQFTGAPPNASGLKFDLPPKEYREDE